MNYLHTLLFQSLLFISWKQTNSVSHNELTINLYISDGSTISQTLGTERRNKTTSEFLGSQETGTETTSVFSEKESNKYITGEAEFIGYWIGDPNTFSRPDQVRIYNMHLDLDIDFSSKILNGYVILSMVKSRTDIDVTILDAKSLVIQYIKDETTGDDLKYNYLNDKLEISLPKGKMIQLRVYYSTSHNSTAIAWISAEQTAGKSHPIIFSHCQTINCRSMLPCQDTPSVKFTYTANITAPQEITVLMSAIRQGDPEVLENGKIKFSYIQKIPIPSYLIALGAGAFISKKIGPRSHVWSEREFLKKAAHDFSEIETILSVAEDLSGPYEWSLYDILVLPASFSFGGMENPCVTFIKLVLLSGEKANVDFLAHEIAHSWTGNLVTMLSFEHFWINEGFTRFVEDKIYGHLYGEPARHLNALRGWRHLKEEIDKCGVNDKFTSLVVNLTDTNPGKMFTTVTYEKGSIFLWYLESLIGVHNMENFLRSYYKQFRYKSISSDIFKIYFIEYFSSNPSINEIDWDTWLYGRGMPPYKPSFDTSLAQESWGLAYRWQKWNQQRRHISSNFSQLENFSDKQKVEFLDKLLSGEPLKIGTLQKMEEEYNLNESGNLELYYRWIRLGLKSGFDDALQRALRLVMDKGTVDIIRRNIHDNDKSFMKIKNNILKRAMARFKKEHHLYYLDKKIKNQQLS